MGAYVGFATVGVFCAWYMYDSVLGIDLSGDGHTTVTWQQLRGWESCASWSPAFQASTYPCRITPATSLLRPFTASAPHLLLREPTPFNPAPAAAYILLPYMHRKYALVVRCRVQWHGSHLDHGVLGWFARGAGGPLHGRSAHDQLCRAVRLLPGGQGQGEHAEPVGAGGHRDVQCAQRALRGALLSYAPTPVLCSRGFAMHMLRKLLRCKEYALKHIVLHVMLLP